MRIVTPILIVSLLISAGCGDGGTPTVATMDLSGTWVGTVVDTTMTMVIGEFDSGLGSEGYIDWGSFHFRLSCQNPYSRGSLDCLLVLLKPEIIPNCFPVQDGIGAPDIGFEYAPLTPDPDSIVAVVSGEVRRASPEDGCVGPVAMSWEPPSEVLFKRP